jgi:hypothetical protein
MYDFFKVDDLKYEKFEIFRTNPFDVQYIVGFMRMKGINVIFF